MVRKVVSLLLTVFFALALLPVVTMAVGETYTLSGNVTEAGTGNALKNAVVAIYEGDGSTAVVATVVVTDEYGNYSAVLPAGAYTLYFYKSGYMDTLLQVTMLNGHLPGQNAVLTPAHDSRTVSGNVTNAISGEALANVAVKAYDVYSDGEEPVAAAVTNDDGNYSLNLPNGVYDIHFSKSGYVSAALESIPVSGGMPLTRDITLAPAPAVYAVSGRVTDVYGGQAIAGVSVAAYAVGSRAENGGSPAGMGTTDGNGRYRIDVPPSTYDIYFSKSGYVSAVLSAVMIESDLQTGQDIALAAESVYTVGGNVSDAANGQALAGVSVEAYSLLMGSGGPDASGVTDGNGGYSLLLPSGTYDLYFSKDGYAPFWLRGVAVRGRLTGMDAVLAAVTTISGNVSDAQGGQGIPDVVVEVYAVGESGDRGNEPVVTETTNAEGDYTVTLPAGVYDIYFYKEGYIAAALTTVTANGGLLQGRNIVLSASFTSTYAVSGRVVDAGSGQAIGGVSVEAYDVYAQGQPVAVTVTDSNGGYSMSLAAGLYDIYFSKYGYTASGLFAVDVNGVMSGKDITLAPVPKEEPLTLREIMKADSSVMFRGDLLIGMAAGINGPGSGNAAAPTVADLKSQFENPPQGCALSVTRPDGTLAADTAAVGTGMLLCLYDVNGQAADRLTIVVKGDLGGNGVTDSGDVLRLFRGVRKKLTLTAAQAAAGKVSASGEALNPSDMLKLFRVVRGTESL
ncbi:MAG TPA: hypothetical protein DEB31_10090 [Clostridiales bacterium]|nr:hypothetical protein [Clostridiales bacterium]